MRTEDELVVLVGKVVRGPEVGRYNNMHAPNDWMMPVRFVRMRRKGSTHSKRRSTLSLAQHFKAIEDRKQRELASNREALSAQRGDDFEVI